MSSSQELYNRIIVTLRPLVPVTNLKQLNNWAWLVVGILQANSINLSQIATPIPVGSAAAESRITTLRRWLKNPHIEVWSFYRPILEQCLEGWLAVEAEVVLDGVQVFGDRLQISPDSSRVGCRGDLGTVPFPWSGPCCRAKD
jgi:hypothetical protein